MGIESTYGNVETLQKTICHDFFSKGFDGSEPTTFTTRVPVSMGASLRRGIGASNYRKSGSTPRSAWQALRLLMASFKIKTLVCNACVYLPRQPYAILWPQGTRGVFRLFKMRALQAK